MNKITVIGLGKLGVCNALIFEKAGFDVLGVDIQESHCQEINERRLRSYEPYVDEYLNAATAFKATTSLDEGLQHSDIIFIVIDTPKGEGDEYYDHSKMDALLAEIAIRPIANKHLVIAATVMPGYLEKSRKELFSESDNVTINYNPEFIAQGNIIKSFENPDIVLIGEETKEAGDTVEGIYARICQNHPTICRMPVNEAEIVKIALNGYITMKLSYANMIADICDNYGADKETVLAAVGADSRVGTKYLKPGYSFGGPCFPRDTYALAKFGIANQVDPQPIHAAAAYNELHVEYMAENLLAQGLESYVLEDVAFKEQCPVPIIEESAKLKIGVYLVRKGKKVIIRDRTMILDEVKKEFGDLFSYESIETQVLSS